LLGIKLSLILSVKKNKLHFFIELNLTTQITFKIDIFFV
jgi:hypothetical protein